MIDTLNQQASATPIAVEVPDPAAAPIEKPQRSQERLEDSARCHYRYPNGRRCTLPGLLERSGFCLRHHNHRVAAGLPLTFSPGDNEDLSAELLPELSEFDTATPINKYLERLLVLATKGRVTPRRAAVLAYLTNQLLHSVHAMDREDAAEPQGFIFDLPRPKRD